MARRRLHRASPGAGGAMAIFAADGTPRLPPGSAEAWAHALGAVYHVAHRLPLDALLGPDSAAARERGGDMRAMLREWWGIEDRDELVRVLDRLGFEGHRRRHGARLRRYAAMFRPEVASLREELRAATREGGEGADEARKELWRLDAVQADLRGLRSAPLLAFDAARAAMLARTGRLLGWLAEGEVLAYLLDVARDAGRTYRSWAEYAADYTLGREVWSGGEPDPEFDEAVEALLHDERSPWVTLPWARDDLAVPRPVRPLPADAPVWTLERG